MITGRGWSRRCVLVDPPLGVGVGASHGRPDSLVARVDVLLPPSRRARDPELVLDTLARRDDDELARAEERAPA